MLQYVFYNIWPFIPYQRTLVCLFPVSLFCVCKWRETMFVWVEERQREKAWLTRLAKTFSNSFWPELQVCLLLARYQVYYFPYGDAKYNSEQNEQYAFSACKEINIQYANCALIDYRRALLIRSLRFPLPLLHLPVFSSHIIVTEKIMSNVTLWSVAVPERKFNRVEMKTSLLTCIDQLC